jgi:hypothetical protein
MGLKGLIKGDHIALNKFELLIVGMPPILFTKVSGIDEELEVTDLPDRTRASGGNTLPIEFTAEMPMHHSVELAAMDVWFGLCQDPVSPTYKLVGTMVYKSISGQVMKSFILSGLFPKKRGTPEVDIENKGDMAKVTWTFSADDVTPLL